MQPKQARAGRAVVVTLMALAALAAMRRPEGPARAAVPDSPVNLDVASDGHVWLVMSTDDGTIGIDRYTANLGFVRGFNSMGGVHDIAADREGGMYMDQEIADPEIAELAQRLVSRIDSEARHQAIWDLRLTEVEYIRALAVDAEGRVDVIVIGDAGEGRVERFGPAGEPMGRFAIGPWAMEIAIADDGTRYVVYNDPDRPHIVRYDAQLEYLNEWDLPAVPMGLDIGPDGKVYLTTRTQTGKDGRVERYLPDGRSDGGFKVAGIGVRIALGPDGSIYINVETPPLFNWEIRRYSAAGAVRASIPWDQMGRRRSAHPPTVTPAASATPTASATGARPTGTPSPTASATRSTPGTTPSATSSGPVMTVGRVLLPMLSRDHDLAVPATVPR